MTLPVLQQVAQLCKAVATAYGPRPAMSPSLNGYPQSDDTIRSLAQEVWGDCDGKGTTEHAFGKGKIVWGAPIEKALAVAPDFSSGDLKLMFIHRTSPNAEIYFVS